MPSFVGNLKILSVGPSSIVHIGDSLMLGPTSSSKTYAGSGSFNTGDLPNTNTGVSGTNVFDPDVNDNNAPDTSVVGP